MKSAMKCAVAAGLVACSAVSANAGVVAGQVTGGTSGGTFQFINPGAGFSVGNDQQQSPDLYAFDENQGVVLPVATGGLAAGTLVNSHYVFFDPRPASTIEGNVTFDGPILALLLTTAELNASDAFLGKPGVNYLTPALRGLEFNQDSASFAGNQLSLSWRASRPGDYIRVLTGVVPEPATWAMMLLGFFAVGAALRTQDAPRSRTRVRYV